MMPSHRRREAGTLKAGLLLSGAAGGKGHGTAEFHDDLGSSGQIRIARLAEPTHDAGGRANTRTDKGPFRAVADERADAGAGAGRNAHFFPVAAVVAAAMNSALFIDG